MSDDLFNTLAAVALMCSHHIQSGFVIGDQAPQPAYEKGFEQCRIVEAKLVAEQARRAEADLAKQSAGDRARLANALAGLAGKTFKPEKAEVGFPVAQGWSGTCIWPTGSGTH